MWILKQNQFEQFNSSIQGFSVTLIETILENKVWPLSNAILKDTGRYPENCDGKNIIAWLENDQKMQVAKTRKENKRERKALMLPWQKRGGPVKIMVQKGGEKRVEEGWGWKRVL